MTGFLITAAGKPVIKGRPCGLLRTQLQTSFLVTDDFRGVIYLVHPK